MEVRCLVYLSSQTELHLKMASPSTQNRSRRPSSSEDQDEEDLVDQMINRTGSMEQYAVQEGRADHQDWRKCQRQVQTFKNCMMTFQKAWKKQLMRQLDVTESILFI
uniref:Cytochrome c oxidase assembly factor 4 homolog n=1 Tax=Hucho hucho TaxID=62062 RepID=A0A4W5R240_9TELE